MSATGDFLVSQSQQQAYYNAVGGPAAKVAFSGATHPNTMDVSLGYTTAWFKYTLEGDQFARRTFVVTADSPPQQTCVR